MSQMQPFKTNKRWPLPRRHMIIASGCALGLAGILSFMPSQDVAANRGEIPLSISSQDDDLESSENQHNNTMPAAPVRTMAKLSPASAAIASAKAQSTEAKIDIAATEPEEIAKPTENWQQVQVKKGDTLSKILHNAGFSAQDIHKIANAGSEGKALTRIRPGQTLEFLRSDEGTLAKLRYHRSRLESITLERNENGFTGEKVILKPEIKHAYAQGEIHDSLFLSGQRAGLTDNLTMRLANIFGYDIDFVMDIREGDQFIVVFEEKFINGEKIGNGDIVAARFINQNNPFTAIRYTDKRGRTDYYDENGRSMRKAFLRTPVEFTRISSRFSLGRKHPILNKIRSHKGVDYAAPTGTPIRASGDGRITFAGRQRGYGNVVIIQHGQKYETRYAHMNGFARGMRSGKLIKQGQTIGYVGMTGLATGPHLHYEFRVNGVHRDPLKVKLPNANPVPKSERQRFAQFAEQQIALLEQSSNNQLAANLQ